MARLVTIAVGIFLLFSSLLLIIVGEKSTSWIAITLIALAFMVFIFSIYKVTGKMQRELMTISRYQPEPYQSTELGKKKRRDKTALQCKIEIEEQTARRYDLSYCT